MTEIVEQKIVSGCKNPFRTFYIAVMHYGVWLLIFLRKEQMQMKLVLAEKPSVATFKSLDSGLQRILLCLQFVQDSLLKLISLSASIFEDVAVATAGEFSVCHEFFLLEM